MHWIFINNQSVKPIAKSVVPRVMAGLVLAALASLGWAMAGDPPVAADGVRTNVSQIFQIGPAAVNQENVRVKFRGILTYQDVFNDEAYFIQDDSAAIFTFYSQTTNIFAPGDELEVEGVVIPVTYSRAIRADQIHLIRHAALPVPKHTEVARLAAGEDFARWVEIEATVRDVCCSKGRVVLACVENGLHFQVWSKQKEDALLPMDLLDARVRLRGVAWTSVDALGRPTGFGLHQPGTNCIAVLRAGRADIFHVPVQNISGLRVPAENPDLRVKVAGVVTLFSPAGWLCLEDESGSLIARRFQPIPRDEDPRAKFIQRDQVPLVPGDRVELVGAVQPASVFAPVLTDSEYHLISHQMPPPPREVASTADLLTGLNDARLVRLKARVVDIESHHDLDLFEKILWLQSDDATFEARLETKAAVRLELKKNDIVQLTGICELQTGQFQQVHSFQLHLRGPDDIIVTRPPPWWTSRAALTLLAGGAAAGLAVFCWIISLRRQVAQRTAALQAAQEELHRSLAEEKELNRLKGNFISMVTHEIRTPLSLILGSSEILSRYLDRLPPEKRALHLQTIDASVERMSALLEDVLLFSKAEAGRLEFNPAEMNLQNFCTQLVDELLSATGWRCPIELSVNVEAPARGDEGSLRHILANLVTNAVKYSAPGTPVKLSVIRDQGDAVFVIRDQGMGILEEDRQRLFTPFYRGKNAATFQGTGLGLVIVKHCVDRHGGTIAIESAANQGTTVTVRLPLFSPAHTEFVRRISQTP